MKILVVPKLRDGARLEEVQTYATAEIQAVWDLYAQGNCREFYARADQPGGVVLMVEAEDLEAARGLLQRLPLVERNLLELQMIPLAPFTHLARLFDGRS